MTITAPCMALTNPPLTDYVTYLGGSFTESVAGIAVDSSGSEYVAGTTNSPDFPLTSTALGVPTEGNSCSFITKFNPAGTGIVFSICIANSSAQAFGMDASGNLYLAITNQSASTLSWSVLKLDTSGQNILYTTMIGAAPESMAVDSAGDVYLAGSAGAGFATTPGAYQPQLAAGTCPAGAGQQLGTQPCPDAFAMKLAPSGSIAWATYLGGSGPDDAHAIAVDSAGSPWIEGETVSKDFPVTAGAFQTSFHGEIDLGPLRYGDAFVAKLDPAGGKLLYSTYLGGSAPDGAFAIAIDASNSAYVTGGTQSTDFPVTAEVLQAAYLGPTGQMPGLNGNAFVTKFESSGKVVYSTFLGGNQVSRGTAIAVDAAGEAAVNAPPPPLGNRTSPCVAPPVVTVVNAAGSMVAATSPVGGSYLAMDSQGGLYSAGETMQLIFLSTPHAYQIQYGGGASDAFVGKVDFSQPAGPALYSVVNAASMVGGYAAANPTGAVAPGELVTLFGNEFGSQPTVNFDGISAPVLFASSCQINAVAPFELTPGSSTFVSVTSVGQTIGPMKLPIVVAAPGIFTISGTGLGQAAVLNQDGTINSAANPAARGSIIAVYMTGAGSLKPSISDGSTGPLAPPFPAPVAAISAYIGGIAATVTFAGQAPTLIAGVTQINVVVPQIVPSGASVPITISAGGYMSQLNQSIVIAVQ